MPGLTAGALVMWAADSYPGGITGGIHRGEIGQVVTGLGPDTDNYNLYLVKFHGVGFIACVDQLDDLTDVGQPLSRGVGRDALVKRGSPG